MKNSYDHISYKNIFLCFALFALLSSCSNGGIFGNNKPKHPGKRIPILVSEAQKPSTKKISVAASSAKKTNFWSLSNSFQRHDIPNNISFTGAFTQDADLKIDSFSGGHISSVSSPVINKSGKIYVLNNYKVHCFDLASKESLWTFKLDDDKERVGGGIFASEDRIYVTDGSKSLLALNANDGTKLWRFEAKNIITYPPLLHAGLIYAVTGDNIIYAIDASTGTLKWHDSAHYQTTVAAASGVNIIAEKNLAVMSEAGGEISIYNNQDGAKVFSIIADSTEEFLSTSSVGIFQPPVIVGSRMFLLNEKGVFVGLDLDTGIEDVKIKTIGGKFFWIDNNHVFIVSDNNSLSCYEVNTGQLIWQQDFSFSKETFIVSQMLVDSKIYLFAKSGEVKIFAVSDGKILATQNVGEISMAPIFYNDMLITISTNGKMIFWK